MSGLLVVMKKCSVCGKMVMCTIDSEPEYSHTGCKNKVEKGAGL